MTGHQHTLESDVVRSSAIGDESCTAKEDVVCFRSMQTSESPRCIYHSAAGRLQSCTITADHGLGLMEDVRDVR